MRNRPLKFGLQTTIGILALLVQTSCTLNAKVSNLNGGEASSSPILPAPTPINSSNQNNYVVSGDCPSGASQIAISIAGGSEIQTTCSSGNFSETIDLSTIADGSISIVLTPNKGTATTIVIVKDTTPPSAPLNLTDGNYFLSTSNSPVLSWDASLDTTSGVDYYQVRIRRTSDNAILADWQTLVSGQSVSGMVLSILGNYQFDIKCIDKAGNTSSISSSDGWTIPDAVGLSPSGIISIITGETLIFTGSNGAPTYSYSDSGSGYVNTTTGVYTAPLNANPGTDTITIADSVGQTALATVNVRAFQTKDAFQLETTYFSDAEASASTIDSNGHIYSTGYAMDGAAHPIWIVRKSTDSGATWSTIMEFRLATDSYSYGSSIFTHTSGAIFVGGYARSGTYYHWIVRKSNDAGLTWSTVDDYQYSSAIDARLASLTQDSAGNIYGAGHAATLTGKLWITRKSTDLGATWTTIDSYQHTSGWDSAAQSVVATSSEIYVGGYGNSTSTLNHWIVRKSADGGLSWTTVDKFSLDITKGSYANAIAITSTGIVYVVGTATDSSNVSHWIVRKSVDAGANWTNIRDYLYPSASQNSAKSIVVDLTGNIYVAGIGTVIATSHWLIQKSEDDGVTWTDVTDYNLTATKSSIPSSIILDENNNMITSGYGMDANNKLHWLILKNIGATSPTILDNYNMITGSQAGALSLVQDSAGNLFSAGYAISGGVYHWIVRKSSDSGSTWTTIDDFQLQAGSGSQAYSISNLAPNTLIVAGMGSSSGRIYWIVRKSTDGGTSWTTVDNYGYVANSISYALSSAVDSNGNIFVSGYVLDSSYYFHWLVRKSSDGGASWTVIDNYQLAATKNAIANQIKVSPTGDVFAVGFGTDAAGLWHWIVRKSTNAGQSWTTVSDFNYTSGQISVAGSVAFGTTGTIYVAGYGYETPSLRNWLVRKSTDGGTSWTTIDNFNLTPVGDSFANAIELDSAGSIFVTGVSYNDSGLRSLVTRKSSNAGATWVTIDLANGADKNSTSSYSITPCLIQQICVAATIYDHYGSAPKATIRILSP